MTSTPAERLATALRADDPSARLEAALAAGTHPHDAYLEPLVARCAIEPDFYVRDMLTWALTRLPAEAVLPRVIEETRSVTPQAVSQALHTLSKLGDARAWPAITPAQLHSPDDEIARTAWRTAAGLAPEGEQATLAGELVRELGRGDLEMKRSLSRALVELGDAARPQLDAVASEDADSAGVVADAAAGGRAETPPETPPETPADAGIAAATARAHHARATLRLIDDPEASFTLD